MQAIVVIALVLHVVTGVFWAGSTFALARMGVNQAREFLRPQLGAAATAIVTGALLWYLLHRGSEGTSEHVLATGAIFALIAAGIQALTGLTGRQVVNQVLARRRIGRHLWTESHSDRAAHCGRLFVGHRHLHGGGALRLGHDPEKAAPDLIRGGNRFSE
jgi:hypothetical protein